MKAYQSTAAQARFADSLGEQVGDDVFEQCFAKAARLNGRVSDCLCVGAWFINTERIGWGMPQLVG